MSDAEEMSAVEKKLRGSWAGLTTLRVYKNIAAERERQGISAAELSKRCSAIGHPIARAVIAKMDSRDRANISIPELMVIAEALGLAPLDLIYPPYTAGEDVERLPGVHSTEQAAREKFVEYGPFNTARLTAETSRLRHRLEFWLRNVRGIERALENTDDPSHDEDYRFFVERKLSRQMYMLQRTSVILESRGVVTPPLSQELMEIMEQRKPEIDEAGVEYEERMSEDGYVVMDDFADGEQP